MSGKEQSTREHIIKTCRGLFTVRGFGATPISAVIEATGVKKGNLYYYFPSKEALGQAVLEDARDDFFRLLEQSCSAVDPRQRIVDSCRAILAEMDKDNFAGGCLFGNAALEMTGHDSRFAIVLQEVFDHWLTRLEDCLAEAGQGGYHCPMPLGRMARLIVAAVEGGIMMSRLDRDKGALEDCIAAIETILQLDQ